MKKAGLITCHNIKNYGSVFQTYATTVVFKKLGYEVEVINYQRPGTDEISFRKKVKEESHLARKPVLKYFFPKILDFSLNKMYGVFDAFLAKYVNVTDELFLEECEFSNLGSYDLYISGSDQIWNSSINGGIIRPYYLSFAPDNSKKISFASSFGKTALREKEIDETRELLSSYDLITTREESGKEIVQKLGLNAEAVLDPTLWLTREEWDCLEEHIALPKKYILVYQLHNNGEMDEYVKKIEKVYKMPCLRIDLYYHYIVKAGKHVICPTPGEVISIIKNSDYIISDSFHMTVFSILYNKKFISIYSSNSFNNRIENILKWLNLENRHLDNFTDYSLVNNEIDYGAVNQQLQERREYFHRWLTGKIHSLEKNKQEKNGLIIQKQ